MASSDRGILLESWRTSSTRRAINGIPTSQLGTSLAIAAGSSLAGAALQYVAGDPSVTIVVAIGIAIATAGVVCDVDGSEL